MFVAAGIYGFALSLMIFSAAFTPALIDLFVAEPYTLGTHGADWEYWQGTSCAFVGIVAFVARRWPVGPQIGAAGALAFIYGVWGIQNLRLVLVTDRYGPLMWGHVLGCLGLGVFAAVTAMRLRASATK
ncbi:MAG: hypothetical protein JJ863_13470 [Deltaproteobacteria bacterium]|nr:hypothetical protein [Deltaproteobacteria bacterium]